MARVVSIGRQDFETMITRNNFYVDKTGFIREWWENDDAVTLITRPRRFGKTLTMNMVECFFSVKYAGRGDLFSGLDIWKDGKFRELQGTIPVISLSFSGIKCNTYEKTKELLFQLIAKLYTKYVFLQDSGVLTEWDQNYFHRIFYGMSDADAQSSLSNLCDFLQRYYNKKVIILLDEFDTPLQAAYVYGYWEELALFIRGLFEATFKTNPYLGKAILTGITRVSKESLFSGLNNLVVVSATSKLYADSFGFTQEEVSAALAEFGRKDREEQVRFWYNGFTFGGRTDIYNPWSITNFLKHGEIQCYWANTSDNALVNELIRRGSGEIKTTMGHLLEGGCVRTEINDHIDFGLLGNGAAESSEASVWNLFLASGYLKVEQGPDEIRTDYNEYDLRITNAEVRRMFRLMIHGWFTPVRKYNEFMKALLEGDIKEMNRYMNDVALATFSSFDSGKKPSEQAEPERFYHGFVLGLTVDMADRYVVTSNRESGYGRYDVMLKPREGKSLPAIIMEFKVHDAAEEGDLGATAQSALRQIWEKKYAAVLVAQGFPEERIRAYGFAFEGKKVLIDGGCLQRVEELAGKCC